jgi:peptidoglycan/LPS O-acetylase OafA/YrhL
MGTHVIDMKTVSKQTPAAWLKTRASDSQDRGTRLDGLTSLRFLAALHVILFHLKVEGILSGGPWWYQNFAGIGYIGVNFFFVLSGFILVFSYADRDVETGRFWRARFARLYPTYLMSLAVTAPGFLFALKHLNLPFFAWSQSHPALAVIATIMLLQAWIPQGALTWNPVCWSLSVESFFYSMFPFIVQRTRRFGNRKLLLGIGASSLASLAISISYVALHPDGVNKINSSEVTLLWKNLLSFNPLVRLPEFIVGMLAGQLFLALRCRHRLGTICIASGVGIILLTTALVGKIPNPLISAGFLSPAFAAIIFGVAQQPRWTRILSFRPFVLLGHASYGLYLFHSYVISRTFAALPRWPYGLRVSGCVAAAIAVSIASYYLIEEPARRRLGPKSRPCA